MMRELTIRVLQPLRRVVLWLTYNHALHDIAAARHADLLEQMALLHAKIEAMHLVSLHRKVDELGQQVERILLSTASAEDRDFASEIHRLDEFIVYHVDTLRTELRDGLRGLQVALANQHATSLHEKVDALRVAVDILPDGSNRAADRVGTLVIEELDRLDGNILHHVAGLRAALPTHRSEDAPVGHATASSDQMGSPVE